LAAHAGIYTQTLEAGRRLCGASDETEESAGGHEREEEEEEEEQPLLLRELRSLEEAWGQAAALAVRRTAAVNAGLQVTADGRTDSPTHPRIIQLLHRTEQRQTERERAITLYQQNRTL